MCVCVREEKNGGEGDRRRKGNSKVNFQTEKTAHKRIFTTFASSIQALRVWAQC